MSLHYEVEGATRGCWDEAEFRREVARAVGYDPFRADATTHIDVHVRSAASLIDGRVEWRNREGARLGERRFLDRDGDCTKLLTELSFAVGLQIELLRPKPSGAAPSSEATGTPSSAALAPTSSSPPASESSTPRPPATDSPASSVSDRRESRALPGSAPWRMWIGLGPSLAWGLSPSFSGQGRLFFGVRRSQLSLELGVEGTLPVIDRQSDGSGFRQYLLGASASFCGHRAELGACLLAKAHQLSVTGLGVDQPRSPTALVIQGGVRLGATFEISEIWLLTPHLDLLGLLTPRTITLNRFAVWDMPPVAILAGVDVAARFK